MDNSTLFSLITILLICCCISLGGSIFGSAYVKGSWLFVIVGLVFCCCCSSSVASSGYKWSNASSTEPWVDEHNRVRATVGQPKVAWNSDIAKAASEYAASCKGTEASPLASRKYKDITLGENIYSLPLSSSTKPNDFVAAWEAEKTKYSHPSKPTTDNLHYTQMINKNVTELGCGCANCNDKKICVCRYNPVQTDDAPY